MNELTVFGDKSLRPMADDLTHALIRTQQAVGLAGNIFTGGIEEVVFDANINPNPTEASRFGSPAAGESFRLRLAFMSFFHKGRLLLV
jgi:glucoamylase